MSAVRTVFAALLLSGCGPSTEEIVALIKSENPVVREDWATEAVSYNEPEVVEALVGVLDDPSDKVRLAAISTLAELNDPAAIPGLLTRLKEDANPQVKEAATDGLGRLKAVEAVPDILAYAEGFPPDDQGQLVAIWALGHVTAEITDAEKRRPVLDFLIARREQSTDKYVRFNATAALRELE